MDDRFEARHERTVQAKAVAPKVRSLDALCRCPLIVFSGLPGVGKSVLARAISSALSAVLIRVDELEAVMRRTGIEDSQPTGLAAYTVAEAVAERCLQAGCGAVVDAVNALEAPRQQWREVGRRTAAVICVVEVVCSDAAEHRRRIESRTADVTGQVLPTWEEVLQLARFCRRS